MKISWILLTYGRSEIVAKSVAHNFKNAGFPIHEIVWTDNGSNEYHREKIECALPDIKTTKIWFPENRGVAKGYNASMALYEGTHMVLTGCDTEMPNNWLADMVKVLTEAPNCGMSLIYTRDIKKHPERIRGPEFDWNGYKLRSAMPIERRLISRELQREVGYFPQCFGLYSVDDLAFSDTAERIMRSKGLQSYCLVDKIALHAGTEGIEKYREGGDQKDYWEMKQREVQDRSKWIKLENLRANDSPRFTPYD